MNDTKRREILKALPGRGRLPSKKVRDLKEGDKIQRPTGGAAIVERVVGGLKGHWLTLRGLDWDYTITVWKRKGTRVAVAQ